MLWRRKPKPLVVPKFSAVEKPSHPIVFEAYGFVPITPTLSHRLTIGRIADSSRHQGKIQVGGLLSRKILAAEGDREEDRRLWHQLLKGYPTHYLRFSYQRLNAPTEPPHEIIHVWLCLNMNGFDANAIARSIGDFLTFIALDQQIPQLLVSTKIYSAESWLFFAFSRYRRFWVEAGLVKEREPMPHVKGYKLTGDF